MTKKIHKLEIEHTPEAFYPNAQYCNYLLCDPDCLGKGKREASTEWSKVTCKHCLRRRTR